YRISEAASTSSADFSCYEWFRPKLYATTTSSTVYADKVQMEPYNKSSTLGLCLVLLTRWLTVNHPKHLRKCAFPQARCFEDKDDSKSTSPA
ncbi:hypothetical protein F2Q68_00011383, partial [Brassica cretica]